MNFDFVKRKYFYHYIIEKVLLYAMNWKKLIVQL